MQWYQDLLYLKLKLSILIDWVFFKNLIYFYNFSKLFKFWHGISVPQCHASYQPTYRGPYKAQTATVVCLRHFIGQTILLRCSTLDHPPVVDAFQTKLNRPLHDRHCDVKMADEIHKVEDVWVTLGHVSVFYSCDPMWNTGMLPLNRKWPLSDYMFLHTVEAADTLIWKEAVPKFNRASSGTVAVSISMKPSQASKTRERKNL